VSLKGFETLVRAYRVGSADTATIEKNRVVFKQVGPLAVKTVVLTVVCRRGNWRPRS
jgi:hypothetical protein